MIASLVSLSAANMRVSRSFCSSALAFSSARSKLSSAKETFSASLSSSSTNSGVNASFSGRENSITPTACSADEQRKAAPDRVPSCTRLGVKVRGLAVGQKSLMMQGCRVRNDVPVRPLPSGSASLVASASFSRTGRGRAGRATITRNSLSGSASAIVGRGEHAAERRGLAHQLEQFGPRLGPHDRFVGRAERREHAGQALLLLFGLRLLVGVIET